MQSQLERVFSKITERGCLVYFDDEICCVFEGKDKASDLGEKGILEILNPTKKLLVLLKIDACIFDSSDGSRCDCAIYDDQQFAFIELSTASKNQREEKRKQAKAQLKATIRVFRGENINFASRKVRAVMVFRSISSDSEFIKKSYPSKTAASLDSIVEFANSPYFSTFEEGNQLEF